VTFGCFQFVVPDALLVVQIQVWNALAWALPLGKRWNNSWSYLCPRNVLLGWLDLSAIFLILNRSMNQIVKSKFDFTNLFCALQNIAEISWRIPPKSFHTPPLPFPKVPEETTNLLEVGERSSSNQERNNHCCQNSPFDYCVWQNKLTLAERRKKLKSSPNLETVLVFLKPVCGLVAFVRQECRACRA